MRRNIKTKRLSDKLNYKKLRPFKIKKIYRPVTIKLDLLSTIRIHSIFYKLLLELYYNKDTLLRPIEIDKEI